MAGTAPLASTKGFQASGADRDGPILPRCRERGSPRPGGRAVIRVTKKTQAGRRHHFGPASNTASLIYSIDRSRVPSPSVLSRRFLFSTSGFPYPRLILARRKVGSGGPAGACLSPRTCLGAANSRVMLHHVGHRSSAHIPPGKTRLTGLAIRVTLDANRLDQIAFATCHDSFQARP